MRKLSNIVGAALLLLAAIVPANFAFAAGYQVIHAFCREGGDCPNGSNGFGLVRDAAGNLYGVSSKGGVPYATVGLVFELSPNAATGKWDYRVIHTFCQKPDCKDSGIPSSALIIDKSGNLYSTTLAGDGVVYKLSPNADRSQWYYTTIKRFRLKRGAEPFDLSYAGKAAGLPYDGVSPLYGATSIGERFFKSIFELRPTGGTPAWKFNIVHGFCRESCVDGYTIGPVTVDASGNLYGVAEEGGPHNAGLVFRFSPKPDNAGWKRTVLHVFCSADKCADGQNPSGPLFLNADGNLIGTAAAGGGACPGSAQGCGMIYQLAPDGTEKILRKFCQSVDCSDGAYPDNLVSDGAGNLFGTTNTTAFVLRKNNTLKTLLTFCTAANCGTYPGSLVVYSPTQLAGAAGGGLYGQGLVFEITHNPLP